MGVTTSIANVGSTLVPINTYTVTGSAIYLDQLHSVLFHQLIQI